MPGNAPPVSSELDGLLTYLRQQRDGLVNAAYGLTEDQLRLVPTKSALSVGGLLKHAAATELSWVDVLAGREQPGEDAYLDTSRVGEDDTLASLTAGVAAAGRATEAAVAAASGPDAPVTPPLAPWMPTGDGYTVRWVLLHIFEELSRHAGHADIIREHVDGATMYELMAGAEGWPETDWLTPWRPPG